MGRIARSDRHPVPTPFARYSRVAATVALLGLLTLPGGDWGTAYGQTGPGPRQTPAPGVAGSPQPLPRSGEAPEPGLPLVLGAGALGLGAILAGHRLRQGS